MTAGRRSMTADLFTGLNAAFEDILGKTSATFPESVRRKRWAAWLRAARRAGSGGREMAKLWLAHECHGCKHQNGAWCDLQGLPCTVNPVLSFRGGMIGMACMGAGFEESPLSDSTHQPRKEPP
jgi:hypothetical protein